MTALNLLDIWSDDADPARQSEGLGAGGAGAGEFQIRTDRPASASPPWSSPRPPDFRPPNGPDSAARPATCSWWWHGRGRPGAGRRRPRTAGGPRSQGAGGQRTGRAGLRAGAGPPRPLVAGTAEILQRLGDAGGHRRAAARAGATPPVGARDCFLTGIELTRDRRFADALPLFEAAVRLAPGQYRVWLAAGNCHTRLGQFDRASACFSTCLALWAGHPSAWFNRGHVALRQGAYDQAAADFDRASPCGPTTPGS